MNRVDLIGQIVGQPQYFCTERGQDLLRFQLQTDGVTHHCTAWGELALGLHQNANATDQVMIRGELYYRERWMAEGARVRFPDIKVRGYTYLG